MQKYFSWDSSLFIIVSVGLIVLWSSVLLFVWLLLSAVFIISKAHLSKSQSVGLWGLLVYGGIFSTVCFGFFWLGLVLFGFWLYISYQIYLA